MASEDSEQLWPGFLALQVMRDLVAGSVGAAAPRTRLAHETD